MCLTRKTGPLRRSVLIAFTLILIVGAILVSLATRMTPYVRDRAIAALNERFRSEVALDSLQISTFPRPEVSGGGLDHSTQRPHRVTPLIRIESFSASAGLWGLMRSPLRLKTVEVDRLEISIPPAAFTVRTANLLARHRRQVQPRLRRLLVPLPHGSSSTKSCLERLAWKSSRAIRASSRGNFRFTIS